MSSAEFIRPRGRPRLEAWQKKSKEERNKEKDHRRVYLGIHGASRWMSMKARLGGVSDGWLAAHLMDTHDKHCPNCRGFVGMTGSKASLKKLKRNYIVVQDMNTEVAGSEVTEVADSENNTIENIMHQTDNDGDKDQSGDSEMVARPMEGDDSMEFVIKEEEEEEFAPEVSTERDVSQTSGKLEEVVDETIELRPSNDIDTEDGNSMEIKYEVQSDSESTGKDEDAVREEHSDETDSRAADKDIKKEVSFSQILATIAEKAMGPVVPQQELPKAAQSQMQSILKSQSVAKDLQPNESESEEPDSASNQSSKSSVVIVFSGNVSSQPRLYPRERHSSGRSRADATGNPSQGSPDNPTTVCSSETPSSDSLKVLEVAQVLSAWSQTSPALPVASEVDHQSHAGTGIKRGRMGDEESLIKRSRMQADFKSAISGLVIDEALKEKLGITAEMDEATQNLLLLAEQISQENLAVMVRQKSVEVSKKDGGDAEAEAAAAGQDRMVKAAEDIWVQIDPHREATTTKETSNHGQYNLASGRERLTLPDKEHSHQGALDLLCEAVNAVKSDEMKANANHHDASLGLVKQEPMEWVETQPQDRRTDWELGPSQTRGAQEGGHILSMMKSANKVSIIKFVHLDLLNWKVGGKLVKKLTDNPVGLLEKRGITRELALKPVVTTATKVSLTVGEFLELYFTALWFQHCSIKINLAFGCVSGKFHILHKWLQVFYGVTDSIATVKSRTESILDMYMVSEENYRKDVSHTSFYCLKNFLTSALQWQLPPPPPPVSSKPPKGGLPTTGLARKGAATSDGSELQGHFPQLTAKLGEMQADSSTSPDHEEGETSDDKFSSEESDDEMLDSPPAAAHKRGRQKGNKDKAALKYPYNFLKKKKNATATDKPSAHSTSYKRPYSPNFRLQVLKFAESYGNNSAASRKYGVSVRQIRKWRDRRGEIYIQAGLHAEEEEEAQEVEDSAALDPELYPSAIMGPKLKRKYSSHTPVGRQRLRPWLTQRIGTPRFPGLEWIDRKSELFKVPWKHWKNSGWLESDSLIFKEWAVNTGRFHHGEKPEWAAWKTRLRCALNQMPDITELKNMRSKKSKTPYRVFKFISKDRKDDDEDMNNTGTLYPVVRSELLNIPTLVTEIAEAETIIKMEPQSPSNDPPVLSMEISPPSPHGTCTTESHPLDSPPVLSTTLLPPSRPTLPPSRPTVPPSQTTVPPSHPTVTLSSSTKDARQRKKKQQPQPEDSVPIPPAKDGLVVANGASQANNVPVPSLQLSKDANIEQVNITKDQPSVCSTKDSSRDGQQQHSVNESNSSLLESSKDDPLMIKSSSAGDEVKDNPTEEHDQTMNSGNDDHCDPPVHMDEDATKDRPSTPPKKIMRLKKSKKGVSSKDKSLIEHSVKDDSPKNSKKKQSPKHSPKPKDGPPKLTTKDGNQAHPTKDAMPSPPMPLTKDHTPSAMVDCSPDDVKSSSSATGIKEEPEDEDSQELSTSGNSNDDCFVFYKSI